MRDISQGSTVKMRHIDFWCDTCALAAALIKQEWKLVMDGTVMCCVWSSSLENTITFFQGMDKKVVLRLHELVLQRPKGARLEIGNHAT